MKTILYNPIFINPQAYYVFPRLTRYLQPDNESTAEPANYIGTIEVKVIAYGDTTLKRTYTNTDSIDLSEFKNTWIRISLFTKVGSCVLGEWKIGNMESDLPYIDPEVLASLKAVVIVGNKTNNDSDRAIVKNLVDPDNPFVISNAAFKLNSGFGKYEVDFTVHDNQNVLVSPNKLVSIAGKEIISLISYAKLSKDIPSYKVKITGLDGEISYWYRNQDGTESRITITEDGIYQLPVSYNVEEGAGTKNGFNGYSESSCTIEQIPSFQGAFVTDGIDDLITSTKTVQEMLGGSNEITVVSMIHQVKDSSNNVSFTNYIRGSANGYFRNIVNNYDKTGIYGYTSSDLMGLSVVNNILGDKNDYTSNGDNRDSIINGNFSVQGYSYNDGNNTGDFSSVAWYWTIIANKVLTTDQINQVIAYFNLDRTLRPDILCNITKQGITNDNHADFNDKLIDYSGNGRDIQMYNLAWKGGSGIAAKPYETFKDWLSTSFSTATITNIDEFTRIVDSTTNSYWVSRIRRTSDLDKVYEPINIYLYQDNNVLIHECKYKVDGVDYTIPIYELVGKGYHQLEIYSKDRYIGLPENAENIVLSEWYYPKSTKGSIKYSIIPSCKGGIILDGIEDFGKVTGMPIYKDYTFISKYQRLSYREAIETEGGAVIASKSYSRNQGAFIFNGVRGDYAHDCYSFGLPSSNNLINDKNLEVYYQTKYTNQGKSISSGTAADSDILWLGTVRDNDNRFINAAIYSLMSFPYSMSEFLIERQLKKHKLGTLYPDMVEFRPIVKSNNKWDIIEIWQGDKSLYRPTINDDKTGIYLKKDSTIGIYVKPYVGQKVSEIVYNGVSYTDLKLNSNGFYYITVPVTKSPQKIGITIEQDENEERRNN